MANEVLPLFSLVIPTYQRPEQLNNCLNSLLKLTYPPDQLEIIVVDDGGAQSADSVVLHFADRLPVRVLRQKNAGPGAARNLGAKNATGEYLVFTDDDCAPHPDWLMILAAQLTNEPTALVGGYTVNILRHNIYSAASQLLIDYLYEQWNQQSCSPLFFTSNNMAMRTREFEEIGGFDPTFRRASEDREFCERWNYSGRKLIYAPDAIIGHAHNLSLRSLWHQHFTYGRGGWQFYQSRTRQSQTEQSANQFKPCFRFYRDLIRHPLGSKRKLHSEAGAAPLMLLFAVTQIATVSGYLYEKGRGSASTTSHRLDDNLPH